MYVLVVASQFLSIRQSFKIISLKALSATYKRVPIQLQSGSDTHYIPTISLPYCNPCTVALKFIASNPPPPYFTDFSVFVYVQMQNSGETKIFNATQLYLTLRFFFFDTIKSSLKTNFTLINPKTKYSNTAVPNGNSTIFCFLTVDTTPHQFEGLGSLQSSICRAQLNLLISSATIGRSR